MKLGSAGKDPTASFGSILFLVETEVSKWVGCRAVTRPQFSFYSPAHPATILPWVRGQSRCRGRWFAGNQVPSRTHGMLSVFGRSWQRWWPGPEL